MIAEHDLALQVLVNELQELRRLVDQTTIRLRCLERRVESMKGSFVMEGPFFGLLGVGTCFAVVAVLAVARATYFIVPHQTVHHRTAGQIPMDPQYFDTQALQTGVETK